VGRARRLICLSVVFDTRFLKNIQLIYAESIVQVH
jgi:hypothetical protein